MTLTSIVENPTIRHWWRLEQVFRRLCDGANRCRPAVLNLSLAINYADQRHRRLELPPRQLAATRCQCPVIVRLVAADVSKARATQPLREAPCCRWLSPSPGYGRCIRLQAEAVTYIVQRAESLAALFYLLTLYCLIRAARNPPARAFLVLCGGAGLPAGHGHQGDHGHRPADGAALRSDFSGGLVSRGPAASLGLVPGPGCHLDVADLLGVVDGLDLPRRGIRCRRRGGSYALTEPKAILHYLRAAVWPYPLCAVLRLAGGRVVAGDLVSAWPWWGLCGLATVWALVRQPAWGFVGAWFFVILAPTSSVVPTRDVVVEHRMYLPLAAVLTLLVLGVLRGWPVRCRSGRAPGQDGQRRWA